MPNKAKKKKKRRDSQFLDAHSQFQLLPSLTSRKGETFVRDIQIMSDPRIRTLKIKTGVVKRLAKEKVTYEKEAAQQRERIQKLKEQGEDRF